MSVIQASATLPYDGWREVTLRLQSPGTLKDIFDAGLQPYHYPGLERTLLEEKHLRMTIIQSDGAVLPQYKAQTFEIHVTGAGLLASIEMTCHVQTLADCRVEMLRWLPFGSPRRSEAELEAFLAAVKADPVDYGWPGKGPKPAFLNKWTDSTGIRYDLSFKKGFNSAKPLALNMHITWPRTPLELRTYYSEPIPPPPGYEHVSMKTPADFGPDSAVDDHLPAASSRSDDFGPPPQTQPPMPPDSSLGGVRGWWWLAGACLVLLFILLFLRRWTAARK